MSMYGVNGSVPKTLVRHLVRYYADTCGEKKLSEILLDILDLSLIHILRKFSVCFHCPSPYKKADDLSPAFTVCYMILLP